MGRIAYEYVWASSYNYLGARGNGVHRVYMYVWASSYNYVGAQRGRVGRRVGGQRAGGGSGGGSRSQGP